MNRRDYWPAWPASKPERRFAAYTVGPTDIWEGVWNDATPGRMIQTDAPLMACDWIGDALADPQTVAIVGKRHGLRVLRYGRSAIVDGAAWAGGPEGANATIEHCNVGGYATRGGLGMAILRDSYPRSAPTLNRPNHALSAALRDGLVGGRVDTIHTEPHETLWEADINMAYTAALLSVPCGPVFTLMSPADSDGLSYRWWSIEADEMAALGPLPERCDDGVHYPRAGNWQGWYWSFEIEAARSVGMKCYPGPGWGWRDETDALAPGAHRLWYLRQTAPTPDVALNVKLAANEAIGVWGCEPTITRLSAAEDAEGLEHIDPILGRTGIYEQEEYEEHGARLIHLASYVYARTRIKLWEMAYGFALHGSLVATNFDSLLTTHEQPPGIIAKQELGGWKTTELHHASTPKARWLVSDEKTTTPGLTRAQERRLDNILAQPHDIPGQSREAR